MLIDKIIAYEYGNLNEQETIKLFSDLIKSGQCWSLQGSYGRTAKRLIESGIIDDRGNILGNYLDN